MLPFLWDNILSPAVFFCSVHISKCAICELCSIPTSWKHFVKGGGCTWQRPDKNPYRYRYPDVIQLSDIWNMSAMQINTIWKETFCTVSLKWSFSSRAAFASLSQPSVEQEGVTVIMAYIIFCINIIEKYPNLKPSITHQIRQSLEESMKLSDRMETQTQSRGFSPLYCVPHVLPSALNFLHTIPKSLIILQVPEDKKKKYIYIYKKMYKFCNDPKIHSTYNFRGFQAVLWKSVNKVKVVCCLTKMQFPYSNISGPRNKTPPITSLTISSQTFHL